MRNKLLMVGSFGVTILAALALIHQHSREEG